MNQLHESIKVIRLNKIKELNKYKFFNKVN